MRAFLFGLVMFAMPVMAQFSLPNKLPPVPEDGCVPNDTRTHCIVNFADWMKDKTLLPIAEATIKSQEARIRALEEMLEEEVARKTKRCAAVERRL